MESEKLYYSEPYLKEIEATLINKNGSYLTFDKSIFYPEGGGQKGDRGSSNSLVILDTKKEGLVAERLEGWEVGKKYHLDLDWSNRYHYMIYHSAQHLISALLFHEYNLHTFAIHLSQEELTIEFEEKEVEKGIFIEAEEKINAKIRENLPIKMSLYTHEEALKLGLRREIKVEGDVRVVSIGEYDSVGCAGVHVKNSSEIKEVVFLNLETIRGHVRTKWAAGDEALKIRKNERDEIKNLSHFFSSPLGSIYTSALKEREKQKRLEEKLKIVEKELAKVLLEKNSQKSKNKISFISPISVEAYISLFEETQIKEALILDETEKHKFLFFGTKNRFDEIKKILPLRGGGKEPYFSGSYISAFSLEEYE